MKNKDKIDLRREKLRKLLLQEMEQYQYQAYSNNFPETILNKFIFFIKYNSKNNKKEEEKNTNEKINNRINNFQIQNNNNNNEYDNREINYGPNITLKRNINEFDSNQKELENNNNTNNNNQERNFSYNNEFNQQNNQNINTNQVNENDSYKYGNSDIDAEINGYTDYYNKLRIDEFMSKKRMQDDLLSQINQKLDKINKNINDKTYQENLAFQYFQNKNRINYENNNNGNQ